MFCIYYGALYTSGTNKEGSKKRKERHNDKEGNKQTHFSTLKMEAGIPPKCWHLATHLHRFTSPKAVILKEVSIQDKLQERRKSIYIYIYIVT
jgi:hypothetical protein